MQQCGNHHHPCSRATIILYPDYILGTLGAVSSLGDKREGDKREGGGIAILKS